MSTRAKKTDAAGQGDLAIDVLRQFRVVFRSVKRHFQRVEDHCGVSGAQLWALERVGASPGMGVGDLAGELAVHTSTASNLVGRLEELAMIQRRRESTDQRQVQLYLTAQGQAVLEKAPRPLRGLLLTALTDLPPDQLAAMHQSLAALVKQMDVGDVQAAQQVPLSEL